MSDPRATRRLSRDTLGCVQMIPEQYLIPTTVGEDGRRTPGDSRALAPLAPLASIWLPLCVRATARISHVLNK